MRNIFSAEFELFLKLFDDYPVRFSLSHSSNLYHRLLYLILYISKNAFDIEAMHVQ